MEEVELLIDEELINERIEKIGATISKDYQGKDVVMICVLKGAVHFFTKLCEKIEEVNITEGFIKVKSYENGTESNLAPEIQYETNDDVVDKDVIIVEDIIDTGHSLAMISNYYREKGANSVAVAVMLDKPSRRENFDVSPEYTGFTIPNLFVVGRGLDFNEEYRGLPYIGVPRSQLKRPIDIDREQIKAQLNQPVRAKEKAYLKQHNIDF